MAPSAVEADTEMAGAQTGVGRLDPYFDSTSDTLTMLRSLPEPPIECQVCVVGAGPAGLMLAANLGRFGVQVEVIDDRADQTPVGRADGLQPKTIETFRQMRLADQLLQRGVRVYDIAFWRSTSDEPLRRLGREVHYPPVIDVLDPYILLVHQGMVEGLFIDDLRKRGVEVRRNTAFDSFSLPEDKAAPLQVHCRTNVTQDRRTVLTQFLVGCDGAHSKVRKSIPEARAIGLSQAAIWGVLDGELITDFPDIWSKTLVYSQEYGSILIIPRERNMTRFYIELKAGPKMDRREWGQDFIMQRAKQIMAPFKVEWRYIEWFGRYQIGQRVASKFGDNTLRAFLAGDASHTHSPKAAQGMNTSMHDSWNLAWKLNLAVRGLAKPELLDSYESERRKIALDLVNFDYEHANQIAGGDAVALAENFRTNVRFISGIGAEYSESKLSRFDFAEPKEQVANSPDSEDAKDYVSVKMEDGETPPAAAAAATRRRGKRPAGGAQTPCPAVTMSSGEAQPGRLLPPAKVARYIDSNPVDIQLDIPMMGQFRIYLLTWDVHASNPFLETFCQAIASTDSFISKLSAAASASYAAQPRPPSPEDVYQRPERYTAVSHLFTFSLITTMPKSEVEISDLPALLQDSRWTFYLDNIPQLDTRGSLCTTKWLGSLGPGEVAIVNVRPDGYVGSIGRWDTSLDSSGVDAARWLDRYYDGFLKLPPGFKGATP